MRRPITWPAGVLRALGMPALMVTDTVFLRNR
jgi:hypothetical protein